MGSSSVTELPLLPLRDVVVYPHMVIPLFVGREKSIEALEYAMASDKEVLLVAQRNAGDDAPARGGDVRLDRPVEARAPARADIQDVRR